ncbi:MAG TPA: hypothetical protein VHE83_06955 [Mycobacteriales bacterium]|nr:hypothetical protein [Mycobacteriales bacterium]
MPIGYFRHVRSVPTADEAEELVVVDDLARQLRTHLEAASDEIDAVHVHGAGSSAVQTIVSRLLRDEVGFHEEQVMTRVDGWDSLNRPDFIYKLGPGRGILAEVERGGTTTNNHDLKDFWKTHLAPDAQHLFLIVPRANFSADGYARERPFALVKRRIGGFFGDPRREVDVLSAHVFGYGREGERRSRVRAALPI